MAGRWAWKRGSLVREAVQNRWAPSLHSSQKADPFHGPKLELSTTACSNTRGHNWACTMPALTSFQSLWDGSRTGRMHRRSLDRANQRKA
eukprot:5582902-Lingulodinium_polyedra.AAC.1